MLPTGPTKMIIWAFENNRPLYRFLNRCNTIKWWFLHRFHPKYRFHVINLRPYLGFGWHDRDIKIYYAVMNEFADFVEKEDGLTMLDEQVKYWDTPSVAVEEAGVSVEECKVRYENALDVAIEVRDIYEWWRWNGHPDYYADDYDEWYETATKNIQRIAAIRKYLWT